MTTASQLDYASLTQTGQLSIGAAEQAAVDFPVVRPDSWTRPVRSAGSGTEVRHHGGNFQRFAVDTDL